MKFLLEKFINILQAIEDKITGQSRVYIRLNNELHLVDDVNIETIDDLRAVVIDVYSED